MKHGKHYVDALGCVHEGFEVSERTDERRYGGCLVCDEGCAFGFLSHLWVSRSRKFGKDCMVAPIGAPNPEKKRMLGLSKQGQRRAFRQAS